MDVRIYMAGGMSGYTLEEQLKWRNQVKDALLYGDYDIIKKPIFFSPPEYYSPATTEHSTRICDSMRELVEHVANFYLK